jgi:hypothetical protein
VGPLTSNHVAKSLKRQKPLGRNPARIIRNGVGLKASDGTEGYDNHQASCVMVSSVRVEF